MCISVSFVKSLRAPIQENICKQLLLKTGNFSFVHSFISFEVHSCLNQMVRAGEEGSLRQLKKNNAERKTFAVVAGK